MIIKVAIVEDDPEFLNCLADFLNQQGDLYVAGMAATKEEAVNLAKMIDLDIILMDVNLSENKYDGIYCAAEISQVCKAKIIMLTVIKEEPAIIRSFTAGAVNYILKENFLDIPATIRTTYYGVSPIEVLAKSFVKQEEERILNVLTPSEREVFNYISSGFKLPQIAAKQYKTIGTLKSQVNKILKKLDVPNSKEAIRKVKMRGLSKEIWDLQENSDGVNL